MVRRGSFGRSPRPAASLTNTIVAIAREMQQQNDQNIVDAWSKGGLYQGKKVTDQMILAYWKDRMGKVDKNDPLYDTYQNAYMEYDYSIHESIMRTAYDQGKVSDSAAAAFYLNWSKKVPKNSEFWRVLQRDAAQFTRTARANSQAKAAQAKELAYNNGLSDIEKSKVAPGNYLLDVFKNLAQKGSRPGGGNPLIDPMNGELYQFDAGDVQDMIGMIDRLTQGGVNDHLRGPNASERVSAPSGGVLYHDDMGNPITASDVLAKLQGFGFKGNLTLDSLYTLIDQTKQGLKQQADLATKTGHFTDATKINNQLSTISEVGREIKAWPVEQSYLDSRNQYLAVVNDPQSSAQDIVDATNKYRAKVQNYANDPSIAADDVFRNKLIAEAQGTEGATTAAEDFTGLNQGTQPRDISYGNMILQRAQQGIDAVNSQQAVWTQGEYDKQTGAFVPSPGGSQIGAATPQDIYNHSGGVEPQVAMVMDKNGRFNQVAVMGIPVTAHSFAPDGSELPIQQGKNPVVGYIFNLNGKQTVQYKDGNGNTLYSDISNAPWGQGARLSDNGKGYDLNIPMPTGDLSNTGFATSQGRSGQTVLQYDPQQAMLSTDPEHKNAILNGGGDPNTDFRSYAVAVYHNDPQGPAAMNGLKNNPQFNELVKTEAYVSTGFQPQFDDKGNQIGWQGGDQHQLDRATSQNTNILSGGHSVQGSWDRSTPASGLTPDNRFEGQSGTPNWNTDFLKVGTWDINNFKPLAVNSLQGTGFDALGGHFQPGTLNPNFNDHGSSGINDIKLSGTIKVPSVGQLPTYGPPTPVNYTPPQYSSPIGPGVNGQPMGSLNTPTPTPQQVPSSKMKALEAL